MLGILRIDAKLVGVNVSAARLEARRHSGRIWKPPFVGRQVGAVYPQVSTDHGESLTAQLALDRIRRQ